MATAQTGVWHDYSQPNAFLALTLTLRSDSGGILLSFLTLLVASAGACAWSVVAFAIHQYRARREPADALYLQTQVIFRNTSSPLTTIWQLGKIGRVWIGHCRKPYQRVGVLIVAPLLCWIVFTVCGILVGKVVTPSNRVNNVLVKASDCGFVQVNNAQTFSASEGYGSKNANDSRIASAFVDDCYDTAAENLACATLPSMALNMTMNTAACPFGNSGRCTSDTLYMDSGYIDSNGDLGINAPTGDRVQIRIVQTCSVITARDVTVSVPDRQGATGYYIYEINFGLPNGHSNTTNYTYPYPTRLRDIGTGYTISTAFALADDTGNSSFSPISAISIRNADLNLHFVSANSIQYLQPVLDPVFSANGTFKTTASDGSSLYAADQYVNTLACTDQYEYRNPVSQISTGLVGYSQTRERMNSISLSTTQRATLNRLHLAAWSTRNANIVIGQGTNALQATKSLYNSISPGLPADQWKREVQHWFKTSLANLQRRVLDFPTNPWHTSNVEQLYGLTVSSPSEYGDQSPALTSQCSSQRVQSTGRYVNFIFPAVIIIIVVSVLIIAISIPLASLISLLPSHRRLDGSKRHKYRAYIADENLSLLRMALSDPQEHGWRGSNTTEPWRSEAVDDVHVFEMPTERDDSIDYRSTARLVLQSEKLLGTTVSTVERNSQS